MELNNIGSTFSFKSDITLSEIIKKNNLDETETTLLLTAITMYFSRNEISEKDMIDLIEKEIHIPRQTAEQIAKDLKEKVIPTLWNKMPEAERERLLNGEKKEYTTEGGTKKPNISSVEENEKMIKQERGATRIARPVALEEKELTENLTPKKNKIKDEIEPEVSAPTQTKGKSRLPKKTLPTEKPMPSGPDKYRESI